MANIRAIRTEEEQQNEPVKLGDRAMENLRFIRETMERSTHFTAVPGYGGLLMGVTALVTTYIASQQAILHDWLITWLVEAALAFSIGILAINHAIAVKMVVPAMGANSSPRQER